MGLQVQAVFTLWVRSRGGKRVEAAGLTCGGGGGGSPAADLASLSGRGLLAQLGGWHTGNSVETYLTCTRDETPHDLCSAVTSCVAV